MYILITDSQSGSDREINLVSHLSLMKDQYVENFRRAQLKAPRVMEDIKLASPAVAIIFVSRTLVFSSLHLLYWTFVVSCCVR